MYAFLSRTLGAERDWVVHSEIYVALMDVIKHLASSSSSGSSLGGGLSGIVKEPVRVEESCGVRAWMWDRGEVVWVRGTGTEGEGEGRSLGDAVKRLERHRQGLERYGISASLRLWRRRLRCFVRGFRICCISSSWGGD